MHPMQSNAFQQPNVFQQYKNQSLETLTPGEVVVKLFEEASKQINIGIFSLEKNNAPKAYNAVAKAHRIIHTLNTSLDMRYPISLELRELYLFMEQQLTEANGTQSTSRLKEILALVDDLKLTFRQAEKLARAQK